MTVILAICTPLRAQELPAGAGEGYNFVSTIDQTPDLPDFAADMAYVISAPTRLDRNSAWFLTGFTIATAGIMAGIDTPVYNRFKDQQPAPYNLMAAPGRFYDRLGPDLVTLGTSGLMVGSGYLLGDSKLARTGWTAAEAVVFANITTGLFKSVLGRKRPFLRDGNFDFELADFDEGSYARSMPSGHTSRIFALSTVIASSYDSPWVRIPAYAVAGSVALQRVESSNHWVSDVVVGGAIGYVMGRALARKNGLVHHTSNVFPVVKGGLVGLNIRF